MIPHVSKERRLSKIETLTLAKNYIVALTDVICGMRQQDQLLSSERSTEVVENMLQSDQTGNFHVLF